CCTVFLLLRRRPPRPPLFPYTTLFRSTRDPRPRVCAGDRLQPPRHHPRRPRGCPDAGRPDRSRAGRALLDPLLGRRRRERPTLLRPGIHRPAPRRRARAPLAADPPPPRARRAGLLPLPRTPPGRADRTGPRRGHPLAHRGILPGHQDPDRPGRTPGPPLDLLATLDPDCDARPRPARRLRRHHPDPPTGRADPADLQRDRPTGQPADRRTDPVPGKRPALEPLATPTPTPRPNQPLPPPTSNMITIYGCSTRPSTSANLVACRRRCRNCASCATSSRSPRSCTSGAQQRGCGSPSPRSRSEERRG